MANKVCMYCNEAYGSDPRLKFDSHGVCKKPACQKRKKKDMES